jgi:hypothetical protein
MAFGIDSVHGRFRIKLRTGGHGFLQPEVIVIPAVDQVKRVDEGPGDGSAGVVGDAVAAGCE